MAENMMNMEHKANSKAYEANYDRIFKRSPQPDCERCTSIAYCVAFGTPDQCVDGACQGLKELSF